MTDVFVHPNYTMTYLYDIFIRSGHASKPNLVVYFFYMYFKKVTKSFLLQHSFHIFIEGLKSLKMQYNLQQNVLLKIYLKIRFIS